MLGLEEGWEGTAVRAEPGGMACSSAAAGEFISFRFKRALLSERCRHSLLLFLPCQLPARRTCRSSNLAPPPWLYRPARRTDDLPAIDSSGVEPWSLAACAKAKVFCRGRTRGEQRSRLSS